MSKTAFPVYRKYSNDKSYFKVISDIEFMELKLERNGFKLYSFEAKILPDRNFIQDLIVADNEFCQVIDEEEYKAIAAKIID